VEVKVLGVRTARVIYGTAIVGHLIMDSLVSHSMVDLEVATASTETAAEESHLVGVVFGEVSKAASRFVH